MEANDQNTANGNKINQQPTQPNSDQNLQTDQSQKDKNIQHKKENTVYIKDMPMIDPAIPDQGV